MTVSFEVQTQSEGRWTIDSVHDQERGALKIAGTLVQAGQFDAIRVVREDEKRAKPEVIFEEACQRKEGKLTIATVETAPPCKTIDDFYAVDARLALGRLLRHYTARELLTPLELLFNHNHLRLVMRNSDLYDRGVQKIASMQARISEENYQDRVDFLYKTTKEICDRAGQTDPTSKKGTDSDLSPLAQLAEETQGKIDNEYAILSALAKELGQQGGWEDKLIVLLDHLESDYGRNLQEHLDGAIAEICDNAEALKDLLGPHEHQLAAMQTLAGICTGRWETDRWTTKALERLAKALTRFILPYTRTVMMERVAAYFRRSGRIGVGKVTDAAALTLLASILRQDMGFAGGPNMAEALTLRALSALSQNEEDLSPVRCLEQVCRLLPNKMARLGYLFDMLYSRFGRRNLDALTTTVIDVLTEAIKTPPLFPSDIATNPQKLEQTKDSLLARLDQSVTPKEVKAEIRQLFDIALSAISKSDLGEKQPLPADLHEAELTLEENRDKPRKTKTGHLVYPAGSYIFRQGELGDNAYFVHKGRVEIILEQEKGNQVIAVIGRGDVTGEMALINSMPRMASARAVEEAEVSALSGEALKKRLDKLQDFDPVLRRLIDIFSQRLRDWPSITR
ncbi:cyclic nucleotide-binding domain-containing protein [Aestuariispira ectoiniformans]|uniref:cyclic nucleotide-binding domain-containing protein n=1 Tax=Aestuariispira ectoiniformans TaxID=2775080 RepID=UPI00223B68DF|nr:cyclic nucleotide-binding domain-containing protein [Aestuariispira ectoiniformans]